MSDVMSVDVNTALNVGVNVDMAEIYISRRYRSPYSTVLFILLFLLISLFNSMPGREHFKNRVLVE